MAYPFPDSLGAALRSQQQSAQQSAFAGLLGGFGQPLGLFGGSAPAQIKKEVAMVLGAKLPEPKKTFYQNLKSEITDWVKITT